MGYSSILYPNELLIDTDRVAQHGDPEAYEETRTPPGFSKGLELELRPTTYGSGVGSVFPQEFLIPESEWEARIKELEERKATISQRSVQAGLPCKDQNGTNFCWGNGPVHCVEITRLMQNDELIPLSPGSVCGPVNGFTNTGGWGDKALARMVSHGVCPIDVYPANQVRKPSNFDEAMKIAANYKVLEWYELKPRSWKELVSCLLRGWPVAVGYNWWGHEVTAVDAVWLDGGAELRIRNSWGMGWGDKGFSILRGSKKLADDQVTPVTARPAGRQVSGQPTIAV